MSAEYAAGLFDADGCVRVSSGTPNVVIDGGDRNVMLRLAEQYGGKVTAMKRPGEVQKVRCRSGAFAVSRRWSWRWSAHGNNARTFLRDVLPYAREKRSQIRAILHVARTGQTWISLKPALRRLKYPAAA